MDEFPRTVHISLAPWILGVGLIRMVLIWRKNVAVTCCAWIILVLDPEVSFSADDGFEGPHGIVASVVPFVGFGLQVPAG